MNTIVEPAARIRRIRFNRTSVLVAITLVGSGVLAIAGLATWKMLQFHGELRAITENDQWEQRLESLGAFKEPALLFFGDSEIAMWPMAESFGSFPIRNRGVKGDQVHLAQNRYESALQQIHPRRVIIEMGTNDLGHHQDLEATAGYLDHMLSVAPDAVLCGLLPVRGEFTANHSTADIARWNQRLKALAAQHHVPFVDFYSVLADRNGEFRAELTADGLHPNIAGYAVMTQAIRPFLQ